MVVNYALVAKLVTIVKDAIVIVLIAKEVAMGALDVTDV